MGRYPTAIAAGTIPVGPTSTQLITADEVAKEVNNLYPTDEGSYRSIVGVFPYRLANSGDLEPDGSAAVGSASNVTYGVMHGVHHAMVRNGQRELLLVHTGDEVWAFDAMNRDYTVILGPNDSSPLYSWRARTQKANVYQRWPTQFVTTPIGIVIIPEMGRMFFYDGEVCAPLGFTTRPSPPTPLGPENEYISLDTGLLPTSGVWSTPNSGGYSHHGLWGLKGAFDMNLGKGRIGTIQPLPEVARENPAAGTVDAPDAVDSAGSGDAGSLLSGSWRYKVSLIDPWGNMSPLSHPSAEVTLAEQKSRGQDSSNVRVWLSADQVRYQFAVDGLSLGPPHTIGRNIYRTKDLRNSGSTSFWFLPGDATPSATAFATVPDRSTVFFPDNVPDEWLVVEAEDPDPAPVCRLAAMAFGRMWAANFVSDPGALQGSWVGRYGMFDSKTLMRPDPHGGEVTGLHAVPEGLLVLTTSSAFLLEMSDDGQSFRLRTLSTTSGCIAPSSIATMRTGLTVWLGRDGFYAYDGERITFLFQEHRDHALAMNRSAIGLSNAVANPESGQYECWVAVERNEVPRRRYKFDGQGWHWDDYDGIIGMSDTCVSAGNRNLVLGVGRGLAEDSVGHSGLWAIDRGFNVQAAKFVSGWIRSASSDTKATVRAVKVWLRETTSGELTIKVRRNFRAEVVNTITQTMYPNISTRAGSTSQFRTPTDIEKNPTFWGTATASSTSYARKRRPFWESVTVDVPTCETFQIEISTEAGTELDLIGFTYDWHVRDESGTSSRR